MAQRIYIVDDEENIREVIRCALQAFQYEVTAFESAATMLSMLTQPFPDLILLDVMMDGMNGMDALKKLKSDEHTRNIPVIMLTAKGSELDKVTGLNGGADDYITKPFGVLELSARIKAVLRRITPAVPTSTSGGVIEKKGIRICPDSHEAWVNGEPIFLTKKEFDLLYLLMEMDGSVAERDMILNKIWGYDYIGESRTLDMHIRTLRQKIGDDAENPIYIKTVRGMGYRFQT